MVMGTEPGKQFRFMDGFPNPASYACGIVKDQERRYNPLIYEYADGSALHRPPQKARDKAGKAP